MNHIHYSFVYVTLALGLVLASPGQGKANLANYSRNAKGMPLQNAIGLHSRDTVPVAERENFDRPFGAPEYTPHAPNPFAEGDAAPSKIIPAFKIEVDTSFSQVQKIPKEYKGFKIEIKATPEPLPSGHDIFFQHGNLAVDHLENGNYSYLLGNFSTADEANAFLVDFLIKRYPEARVVEYGEGGRSY